MLKDHKYFSDLVKNNIGKNAPNNDFIALALEIFNYQFTHNPVYHAFASRFVKNPESISDIYEIPFLPASIWKKHEVYCSNNEAEVVFASSGTSRQIPSLHKVRSLEIYEQSFIECFKKFYGEPEDYTFLALLPGYLERQNSSLVYMANKLINLSNSHYSGFYLNQYSELDSVIDSSLSSGKKTILLGVTHALIDFSKYIKKKSYQGLILMETGGMKGHEKELLRIEVHEILKNAFGLSQIHSEYGMTELLSQAYSQSNGRFYCPEWMKVLIREFNDPLSYCNTGMSGGINIIDLANVFSCSFVETEDIGRGFDDGSFEVLGRFDNAEVRGCNLMV